MSVIRYRYFLRLFLTLWLISLGLAGTASAEMRIFELQHRSAEELAGTVRSLMGDQAKVAVHGNTLVVRSSPADLDEIARLVASYDQPLNMLRITIEQGRTQDVRGRGAGVSARVQGEHGAVVMQDQFRVGDASIFMSTGDADVRLQGHDIARYESRQANQFVSVLEGYPASISVGRAVPFTSQLRYYSSRHPHFVDSVSYQRVDTGFEVRPTVQGTMVRLEVHPFMSFLDQAEPREIVFEEISTTVNIPFGSWYDLGSQLESQGGLNAEILGVDSSTGHVSHQVKVRIDRQ